MRDDHPKMHARAERRVRVWCLRQAVVVKDEGPSDDDVEYWFKIMQEKMTTRFSELRRAFRTLDEDASGSLEREEFK